ncbi:MAG: substrate-binding domain-containing protein [Alphaproteobacteria bacterium]
MMGAMMADNHANARDGIWIVGSSTVFPFSTTVAENFGKKTGFPTPVVESTGSGGGLKRFCSGIGEDYPDITNASRQIKPSEIENCAKAGIDEIIEAKIGYDGIVIANSRKAEPMDFTRKELFMALAKNIPDQDGQLVPNPYHAWNEINPALPALEIRVLGPPPTSGTRDAFVELVMDYGCAQMLGIEQVPENLRKPTCHEMREDGRYIQAGENDNLIIQKLNADPETLGIFGYSFLEQNENIVQGNAIEGTESSFENISAGDYPVSRSLYFYVKKAHIGIIPGIEEFLAEFTAESTWGEDGYAVDKGLIPLPDDERRAWSESINGLSNLGQ